MSISARIMLNSHRLHRLTSIKTFSTKAATPGVPKNQLEHLITAHNQQENGVVYDKRPMKIRLEAGKKYAWCLCGRSHSQPFCDGTHRNDQLKIKQKPIKFMVDETKEYWLCNCKHTLHRPFCDGTHKTSIVQEATSIIRQ